MRKVLETGEKIERDFYRRSPRDVALELLGKIIVIELDNGRKSAGKIVETEAYLSHGDKSSHSYAGQTERNRAMFADGGTLYVYKSYGIHSCMNVVTEDEGKGSAVLIRALEPIAGIEEMKKNRGINDIKRLCNGPGNLTKSLGIGCGDNFTDLTGDKIYILNAEKIPANEIVKTERVGISRAKGLLLRFYIKNNKFISRK